MIRPHIQLNSARARANFTLLSAPWIAVTIGKLVDAYRIPSNVARSLVAIAVLLALTLISIPFAWSHLKLAGLALWLIGFIVPTPEASLAHAPRW